MTKELINQSLRMLYGVTLFKAIDSIIVSIIHFVFLQTIEKEYFFVPKVNLFILSTIISLYVIAIAIFAIAITKKARSKTFQLKQQIPLYKFVITLLPAIALEPLVLYLSEKRMETLFNDPSRFDYMSSLNLSVIDAFLRHSIYLCKWSAFAILLVYFLFLMKRLRPKT